MSDPVRLLVRMRSTPSLAATSFGTRFAAPVSSLSAIPGVQFDASYSPVPLPPTFEPGISFAAMAASPGVSSYIVRATVDSNRLDDFLHQSEADPAVEGVFSDPRIQPIAVVCPDGPVGTDLDVAELLEIANLHVLGMTGSGVRVVIVDTGVNLTYMRQKGKTPAFDEELSWGPHHNQPLGEMPVGHGTMCAYDVCIAAPQCTIVDHALLTSNRPGGSVMDGFLSDAVQSYGRLLGYLMQTPEPFAGETSPRTLVVNNSWGMFHESWDFPVGSPQNYSHNLAHPFNIIVGSLEAAGADILFAAGNCGTECPDDRCEGVTDAGITGANSHEAVLSVAGVKVDKQRIGYSTKGPGRLEDKKPDVACYTHFAGSGVYPADGGTSAATPVAAGVIAAIRRLYPASVVLPAKMRELIRASAESRGRGAFNYEYGHGIVNTTKLLTALESEFGPVTGSSARTTKSTKSTKPKRTRTRSKK